MSKKLTQSWCQRTIPTSVKTVFTTISPTIPLDIRRTCISCILAQPVIQKCLNHFQGPEKVLNKIKMQMWVKANLKQEFSFKF